jgi:Mg-chelatase subunit ChlD
MGFVRFTHPGYLWLLVLIPLLIYVVSRRGGRSGQRPRSAWGGKDRSKLVLSFRLAAAILLIFAVSGIQVALGRRAAAAVVFVVDRSASVAAAEKAAALELLNRAVAGLDRQDEAGVVAFAKNSLIEQPLKHNLELSEIQSTPSVTGTNIEQGLRQARTMLAARPESWRRIVLLSDGNQTSGDALREAAAAAAQGIAVDVVPLRAEGESGSPKVRVEEVSGPDRVRLGEPFDLRVSLSDAAGSSVVVKLSRDGAAQQESGVTLSPKGTGIIMFPDRLTRPGFHEYRIAAGRAGKALAEESDEGGHVVYAYGKPRVLHIAEVPAAMLDEILRQHGFEVNAVTPRNAPLTTLEWSPYDVTILDNTPAGSLSGEQMQALAEHVERYAGGLIMTGGAGSFGPGGYAGTPVEKALPVEMALRKREKKPALAVVLVLDKSGSMGIAEQKVSKLDMAKDAVLRLSELLTPEDSFGIIAFDRSPNEILPLQLGVDRGRMEAAIRPLTAGGGTAILPAVEMAYQRLQASTAEKKHILLLTDGQADPAERKRLQDRVAGATVVLSAVGVGGDVDRDFLQQLATAAHGRIYFTATGMDLPDIFKREASLMAGDWIVERAFRPRQPAAHEMLRNLGAGELPELTGYIATTPKKLSEVLITADNDDPILACWRFGLGKTVAFTSDLAGSWTRRLIEWQYFSRMWLQVVRWAGRGIPDENLHPQVVMGDEAATLVVDAYDNSGRFIVFGM